MTDEVSQPLLVTGERMAGEVGSQDFFFKGQKRLLIPFVHSQDFGRKVGAVETFIAKKGQRLFFAGFLLLVTVFGQ